MAECTCSHDSDLHELGDIGFVDGTDDCLRFRWRWVCVGNYQSDPQSHYPIPCQCTNFTLKAEIAK